MDRYSYRKGLSRLTFFIAITLMIMSFVSIKADAATLNMNKVNITMTTSDEMFMDNYDWDTHTFVVKFRLSGLKKHVFDSSTDSWSVTAVTCSGFNDNAYITCTKLKNNVLRVYISAYDTTKLRLRITVNGRRFAAFRVGFYRTELEENILLPVGQTSKIPVKIIMNDGSIRYTSAKLKAESSNPDAVRVNKNGTITAVAPGNSVITATLGTAKLGCIVCVNTAEKIEAVSNAMVMAKNWIYSQEKRMLFGYYDCSSLVWKALHLKVCDFGSAYWAPTGGQEYEYCKNSGNRLPDYTKAREQAMIYQVGDVYFAESSPGLKYYDENNYLGIYHAEMVSGYRFLGFSNSGKAIVELASPIVQVKYSADMKKVHFGRP